MGAKQSAGEAINLNSGNKELVSVKSLRAFSYGLAPEDQVHHYLPHTLPICPRYTQEFLDKVKATYEIIVNGKTNRMKQIAKPGFVVFFDEYYFRLLQRDTTFSEALPTVNLRASVLVRTMAFIMARNAGSDEIIENEVNLMRFLGHKHRNFIRVRPHHFATMCATLLETIMYLLGELAAPDVAEAWSNVFAFINTHVLEAFLSDNIDPYESYQNTQIAAVREIEAESVSEDGDRSTGRTSARADQSARMV